MAQLTEYVKGSLRLNVMIHSHHSEQLYLQKQVFGKKTLLKLLEPSTSAQQAELAASWSMCRAVQNL